MAFRHRLPPRPWTAAAVAGLFLVLAGAGCAPNHYRLVVHPPAPADQRFEPIAPSTASKRKIRLFTQPVFQPTDVQEVYRAATARVPGADSFRSLHENVVLRIYPSFRFPIFYTLNFDVSGMAGKTLPAAPGAPSPQPHPNPGSAQR